MDPLGTTTETGILTIAGFSMHCPAWAVTDLTDLWGEGDLIGSDEPMPGADGDRAFPRFHTSTSYQLPMVIDGDVDRFGTLNTHLWAGLQHNIDFLNANIVGPSGAANGTRAASLLMPAGNTRTASIHVTRLRLGQKGRGTNERTGTEGICCRAILEIVVPRGRFL